MVLTREERERFVIDLRNQDKSYKEIAKEAKISPRDIKVILDKAIEQKEKDQQKQRILNNTDNECVDNNRLERSEATKGYQLFAENKTPVEVAIALSIRESRVTTYYREYWKLNDLHDLNSLYKELTPVGTAHLLRLYRRIKNAHMGIKHVVNLLKLVNNDLPSIENRYSRLKREVEDIECQQVKSRRILYKLEDQIITSNQMLGSYRKLCQEETRKLDYLRREMIRLRKLVIGFRNNNEEYLKIKKTIEEKVSSILLDRKRLLRLACFSLMESMRKDPDKYSSLIHYNNKSSSTNDQDYRLPCIYGKQLHHTSYDSFFEAYKSMLLDDSEKLYHQLLLEQTDGIITNYASNNNRSLPLRNAMARQTFRYRGKITFTK